MAEIKKYWRLDDGNTFESVRFMRGKRVLHESYPPDGATQIERDEYLEMEYKQAARGPFIEGLPESEKKAYLSTLERGGKRTDATTTKPVQESKSKKL